MALEAAINDRAAISTGRRPKVPSRLRARNATDQAVQEDADGARTR